MHSQARLKGLSIQVLSDLIKDLKRDIDDDYRPMGFDPSWEDAPPGMTVTVGYTPEDGSWNYQTGDNSFSGGAYLHPYWGVVDIYRRSSSRELAKDIIDQIWEQIDV